MRTDSAYELSWRSSILLSLTSFLRKRNEILQTDSIYEMVWYACLQELKFFESQLLRKYKKISKFQMCNSLAQKLDSIYEITWKLSSFHSSSSLLKKFTCHNSHHSIKKKEFFQIFKARIICLEKLIFLINWFRLWGNLMYFKVRSFLAWIVYLEK